MRFQRTDLIDRVKTEIERRHDRAEALTAEARQKYDERLREYQGTTFEAWKAFADRIRLRLRTGKPITPDDIPTELRGNGFRCQISMWDVPLPTERVAETSELDELLKLLEAVQDEEISASSLERMGFRTSRLFRA